MTLEEVIADLVREAADAVWRFGDDDIGLEALAAGAVPHLATDVWVFDPAYQHTLLVEHRVRGWVMPGGRLEPGETMRAAAVRELAEETGIEVPAQDLRVAALYAGTDVYVGPRCWGLSFELAIDLARRLAGEPGQDPAWWALDDVWPSVYPHDRDRLRRHAELRRSEPQSLAP